MLDLYNRVDIGDYYLYELCKIGRGAYGIVHLGESKKTKQIVAIKRIHKAMMEYSDIMVSKIKDESNN